MCLYYSAVRYYNLTATGTQRAIYMGSYSVTCHPTEVRFPPLPQPIKAGTQFCKAELTWLAWLHTEVVFTGKPAPRRQRTY